MNLEKSIKTIVKAILEQQKHSQLCPDTIKDLNKLIKEVDESLEIEKHKELIDMGTVSDIY